MTKEVIKLLRRINIDKFLLLGRYIDNKSEHMFQKGLVLCGYDIVVDGIIGQQTISALRKVDIKDLNKALKEVALEITKPLDESEKILKYLGREEGVIFHWNRGEHSYTTPYGVYRYANPHSDVIEFTDSLIKKYHILETRKGIRKLNDYITNSERLKLKKLVYDFYMRKYVNKSVDKILIRRGMDDLRLSVFSTSVNAGLKKAMFKLQQTIKIYPDGLVGPKTLERLSSIDTDKNILNVTYLVNVKYFYDSLISSNPSKYKRFKNGWYARLERLGLNIS